MTIQEALEQFYKMQAKLSAYGHAMSLIYYDGATTAPKGTAQNRAHALSILSEDMYKLYELLYKLLDRTDIITCPVYRL